MGWLLGNLRALFIAGAVVAVLAVVAHVSKGFLCPDFVTNKQNNPWYCHMGADESELYKMQAPGLR